MQITHHNKDEIHSEKFCKNFVPIHGVKNILLNFYRNVCVSFIESILLFF